MVKISLRRHSTTSAIDEEADNGDTFYPRECDSIYTLRQVSRFRFSSTPPKSGSFSYGGWVAELVRIFLRVQKWACFGARTNNGI
jgi:hypothetical protein